MLNFYFYKISYTILHRKRERIVNNITFSPFYLTNCESHYMTPRIRYVKASHIRRNLSLCLAERVSCLFAGQTVSCLSVGRTVLPVSSPVRPFPPSLSDGACFLSLRRSDRVSSLSVGRSVLPASSPVRPFPGPDAPAFSLWRSPRNKGYRRQILPLPDSSTASGK